MQVEFGSSEVWQALIATEDQEMPGEDFCETGTPAKRQTPKSDHINHFPSSCPQNSLGAFTAQVLDHFFDNHRLVMSIFLIGSDNLFRDFVGIRSWFSVALFDKLV